MQSISAVLRKSSLAMRSYRETIMLLQMDTWAVSKDKWDKKEDKGKSMMCALYVLGYAKRYFLSQKRHLKV